MSRSKALDSKGGTMAEIDPRKQESRDWTVRSGSLRTGSGSKKFTGSKEALTYNNPFKQSVERVWFDGKLVYAVDCGEVEVDPEQVKIAEEYQVVYSLDAEGKPKDEVKGQYNIYDSVPGMKKYSPIWRFNYVMVPRDYEPNSLRSEGDVLKSGYQVKKSNNFEN
jgi:hypothetical protein